MNAADIKGDHIRRAQFIDKEFEDFIRFLLKSEIRARHRSDAAPVQGPMKTYLGDKQRDLVVKVPRKPHIPREEFFYPLTWDEGSRTWYSCKGGRGWRDDIKTELGNASLGKSPGTRVRNRPSEELLDLLVAGGNYVVVVGEPTIAEQEESVFLAQVAEILSFWLDHTKRQVPESLLGQLHLIDANLLADFIGEHARDLPAEFMDKLSLTEPEGLRSAKEWADMLGQAEDRELTSFETDPARESILLAIRAPTRDPRLIYVYGPPGSGKTRVVYEGLRQLGDDHLATRVRYTDAALFGRDLVGSNWFRKNGGGALDIVIDEVDLQDLAEILRTFKVQLKSSKARLLLIGTEAPAAIQSGYFAIDKLDESAMRRLIEREFEHSNRQPGPGHLAQILHQAGGFPLYATRLAQAMAEGDEPTTDWEAAKRVLIGPNRDPANTHHYDARAEIFAKCLLVVILTDELDLSWDELWDQHGVALAAAIDERRDWELVKKAEAGCRQRQVLRLTGGLSRKRYVSPHNLACNILDHFFGGDDDGPAKRILRHLPQFRGAIARNAESVGASERVLERFARLEWAELRRLVAEESRESIENFCGEWHALELGAQRTPEVAAFTANDVIAHFDDEQLRARPTLRLALRNALTLITHHAISRAAFEACESALFRLARIEYPGFGPRIWGKIFTLNEHAVRQPWPERLRLLDARLSSTDVDEVEIALVGALTLGTMQYPRPRDHDAYAQLMSRLVDACSHAEPRIHERARTAFVDNLQFGLSAEDLDRVRVDVEHWSTAQRQQLAKALAEAQRLDPSAPLAASMATLEQALAPKDLFERVVAHVGPRRDFNTPSDPSRDAARDRELAGELVLAGTQAIHSVIQWLVNNESWRGNPLLFELGQVDHERRTLDLLVELVRSEPARVGDGLRSPRELLRSPESIESERRALRLSRECALLSSYLLGWADVDAAIDSWLAEHRQDSALGHAIALTLGAMPPSQRRFDWLVETVESGRLPSELFRVSWPVWIDAKAAGITVDRLLDLATKLESQPWLGISLVLELWKRDLTSAERARALDALERLATASKRGRIVIGHQPEWRHAVSLLAEAGRHASVARLLSPPEEVPAYSDTASSQVLGELLARGLADQLWPTWAERLAAPREEATMLIWRLAHASLLEHVDPQLMRDWIGGEDRRARVVARMAALHRPILDPTTRFLLERFGAASEVGDELRKRALNSDRPRDEPMAFERQQLANARAWQANHSEPEVQRWAAELEQAFTRTIAEYEARQDFRRQYG